MKMNQTTSNDTSDFEDIAARSIHILNYQATGYFLWLFVCPLNALGASTFILVVQNWRPLRSPTQFFMLNQSAAQIGASLFYLAGAAYNLYCYHSGMPAAMTKLNCLALMNYATLFIMISHSFLLCAAIDRFVACAMPHFYVNRTARYVQIVVGLVWFIDTALFITSFVTMKSGQLVPVCIARLAIEEDTFFLLSVKDIFANVAAPILYLVIILILKYREKLSTTSPNQTLFMIKQAVNNKVFRALFANALFIALLPAMSSIATFLVKDTDDMKHILAPYLIIASCVNGIAIFWFYFAFTEEFRNGFRYVRAHGGRKLFRWCRNDVAAATSTAAAANQRRAPGVDAGRWARPPNAVRFQDDIRNCPETVF